MESSLKTKQRLRRSRARRVRKQIRGTSARPRLSIFVSNKNLSAQLIDDSKGLTLASVTTLQDGDKKGMDTAKKLGTQLAEKAKGINIESAVFDRGHRKYHGHLAAFADGAREAGLKF